MARTDEKKSASEEKSAMFDSFWLGPATKSISSAQVAPPWVAFPHTEPAPWLLGPLPNMYKVVQNL